MGLNCTVLPMLSEFLVVNLVDHREPVMFFELGNGHSNEGEWHKSIYWP